MSRVVSAAILGLGIIALLLVLNSADRRRERRVNRIVLDDPAVRVEQVMGRAPIRCPAGPMQHLVERFPAGTPRPTAVGTVERLRAETAERWIYPAGRRREGCTPRTGDVEIGMDAERRVVWLVPATGERPLVYPVPAS
ncbi:MAG TPA: hypothetical protein VFX98_08615 [Longimicrobiaceae bacterium]|nr:hypothetical protein [Longimicrobiaceae bacterium]